MRAIADLYDLLPPDVDRFNFLFNTAVQGSVLEAGDALAGRWQSVPPSSVLASPWETPRAHAPDRGPQGGLAEAVRHAKHRVPWRRTVRSTASTRRGGR